MKIIIRILRTFKNILFPKIYMPWEQNDLDKFPYGKPQTGKIRGTYINHIGMGIAEDFSSCTPKVLQELEEIVDNRRKELLAQ